MSSGYESSEISSSAATSGAVRRGNASSNGFRMGLATGIGPIRGAVRYPGFMDPMADRGSGAGMGSTHGPPPQVGQHRQQLGRHLHNTLSIGASNIPSNSGEWTAD